MSKMSDAIEYLILDYNRPQEARNLLDSIKANSHFDYTVSYLSNGGERDYVKELENEGLIDNLILNNRNVGCGAATIQLFAQCQSEYALYIQVDHLLSRALTEAHLTDFKNLLSSGEFHCVDLAGNQGSPRGSYSERAQLINVGFYNNIPKTPGGPGPLSNIKWTETCMIEYFIKNSLKISHIIDPTLAGPFFRDTGKFSVRSNPDGSQWKQQSDTKQIWMLFPPVEVHVFPHFTPEEWGEVLDTQRWPPGKIPEKMKGHSFSVPPNYWPPSL